MAFTCVKEKFERAVSIAERFSGKNVTLPVLANILLEFQENKLIVTATNLEYAVQIIVPGKGGDIWKTSIPAKILSSVIQSIREEKLELEGKEGNLFIRTDKNNIRINGINSEDFPPLPKVKKEKTFFLETSTLLVGLENVLPAVSVSEFKPELAGVFFKIDVHTLYLVATDTFRLAEQKITLENDTNEHFSFILPQKTAQELSRVLGTNQETLEISFGEGQIMCGLPDIKIISRLIEGNFPEYAAIVPIKYDTSCFIERDEFLAAVRSSSIFASKVQDVTLSFHSGFLEIMSINPEIGENKVKIPLNFSGTESKVSFNYRYLLDGLGVLSEEKIFLGINDENRPSLLKNKEDGMFMYVLMPIRFT